MSRQSPVLILGAFVLIFSFGFAHSVAALGEPATSVSLTPTTATINADQTEVFTLTAAAAAGQQADVTTEATFSTNDPLGTMTGATYHPGKTGTWTVQAAYQSFAPTATMTVTAGAVKELAINPNSDPEFVNLGTTKTFTVRGYDAASNVVADIKATWTVNGDIGTISDRGVFTPSKIGSGKIAVSVGTIGAEVAVVVKEAERPLVTQTNTTTNANINSTAAANTNTVSANTNAAPLPTTVGTEQCKTLATWVWVTILVLFLLAVSVLYAFVPVTKIWPAVVALGGGAALVFVQHNYACTILTWWGWVLSLCTIGLTIMAIRQMPGTKEL